MHKWWHPWSPAHSLISKWYTCICTYIHITVLHNHSSTYTEYNITVGHWPFSDQWPSKWNISWPIVMCRPAQPSQCIFLILLLYGYIIIRVLCLLSSHELQLSDHKWINFINFLDTSENPQTLITWSNLSHDHHVCLTEAGLVMLSLQKSSMER